jgi:hypothetical protein
MTHIEHGMNCYGCCVPVCCFLPGACTSICGGQLNFANTWSGSVGLGTYGPYVGVLCLYDDIAASIHAATVCIP